MKGQYEGLTSLTEPNLLKSCSAGSIISAIKFPAQQMSRQRVNFHHLVLVGGLNHLKVARKCWSELAISRSILVKDLGRKNEMYVLSFGSMVRHLYFKSVESSLEGSICLKTKMAMADLLKKNWR